MTRNSRHWLPCAFFTALLIGGCSDRTHRPQPGASAARWKTRPSTGKARALPLRDNVGGLGLPTGKVDAHGRPIRIACVTCHQKIVPANADAFRAKQAAFHQTVHLNHGTKTCRTCHRFPAFKDFNLADGSAVPHSEVIRLCGQCHARRLVEYQHGAHGGTTGYWDTSKGAQQRNHCLDCHNAHSPRIPKVRPAPRALNRTL